MFSKVTNRSKRSFAYYLSLGYALIYILTALTIYLVSSHVITKSARGYDKQDVLAESEELVELLEQNADGNLLAEQVTRERYPPSTIFIVRVINRIGQIEYTLTWPKKINLPDWQEYTPPHAGEQLPPIGHSEYYIPTLQRHIQIETAAVQDGRILQVGKGSFLEVNQKSMLRRLLAVFVILATLFSVTTALFLIMITTRPIKNLTAVMQNIIAEGTFEQETPPIQSRIHELNTLGEIFTLMTEKYANLIRAMRQTMDNVAHDFRTPLTRIRGSAELALQETQLSTSLQETLADIIEDCDRSKLQLQNLMDAREVESGFVKLNQQHFNLILLVEEIIDLYTILADERAITLNLTAPPAPLMVTGDRARLARVLANLLDNAIKYSLPHKPVNLILNSTNGRVTIALQDYGIGIPEHELALIWQRLYRGQQACETGKGLGLGLNIAQVIVVAHGGTITVTSDPQNSTIFTVTLPINATCKT